MHNGITVLSNITLLINRYCLSIAKTSSSITCLNSCKLHHSILSCYLCTAVINSDYIWYTICRAWFLDKAYNIVQIFLTHLNILHLMHRIIVTVLYTDIVLAGFS